MAKVIGVYVVRVIVVAQVVNSLAFGVRPDVPTLVGGACILTGGLVITVWKP
jgi:small multidrug resistance family-3 protein